MLKGTPKTWAYSEDAKWNDLGVSELVLQKDAAYELGAQGRGSANFVLFTSSPELVSEDKVMLFGRDMGEIRSDCDFARIVLLRIGVMDDDDEKVYRTLKDIEFAKYHVYPEGYMVRMSPESFREQIRVGKTALKKGISFRNIGMNYIAEYKKDPNITGTLTHILEGLPTDCSVCALKDVCEEVEGMKELHFGVGAKGADHH